MCGIAGILELQGAAPPLHVLQAMSHRLRHRGPDGEGIHIDGSCGLVHRRLAIIDPNRGMQPLSNEDGTIWITYNGEIYNSPDLRRYLISKGHVFRTTTDTEAIVHLYEEAPERFVEQLEGMFAFGLWDARRQRLILARDYIGIKPLYYYAGPDCFVFGSEVKALLTDARVPCQPDEKALMEILTLQNLYGERTCFKDISLLEAGRMLVVQPEPAYVLSRKYWDFTPPTQFRQNQADTVVELRSLVETAICDHLMSDVPVASYLSGGMDSGTLTAVATRNLPALMTFSGGFLLTDDMPAYFRTYDERDAAFFMSQEFGTQHHFREITPVDHIENFSAILWHHEEPRGSTCYAPYVIAREVGARVKVILTGHGGDELFAGYRHKYQLAQNTGNDWENAWFSHLNFLTPLDEAPNWLCPDFLTPELLAWPRQAFDAFVYPTRGMSPLARTQHHDLFFYMHGLLLIEDKVSMAHSLESRVPFLDRRIFDFAWSLPDAWKLAGDRGKVILREAMQGLIPDSILARDKMGFGPPDNHYYRTKLRTFMEYILLEGDFAKRRIVKAETIQNILQRQLQGYDLQQHLWTFVSLEMWHRTFFDREAELRATLLDIQPAPVELHLPELVLLHATTPPTPTSPPAEVATIMPAPLMTLSGKIYRKTRSWGGRIYRKARSLGGRVYRKTRSLGGRVYHKIRALPGQLRQNPQVIKVKLKQLIRRPLAIVFRLFLPMNLRQYIAGWWKLVSGNYGVEMRAKLRKQLQVIPRPQPAKMLRVFHGLYHAPQPVFINGAFKEKGHLSIYETLDLNPGFPMVDVHHQMHSPDIYREHAVFDEDTLIRVNPPVVNNPNLDQLEQFFLERWSQYDVFHFNWFMSFLPDNVDVEFVRRSGRPVYFHFRGCWVLSNIITEFTERGGTVADACQHCKNMGWRDAYFSRFYRGVHHAARVFTSTPNLCHCSPDFEYIPNSLEPTMELIPPPSPKEKQPDDPVIIMHSVFNERVHKYKGTPHVLKAIETLKQEGLNIEFRLIEKMSRAKAVEQYGQCDIFVEQLHLGCYSNVAIEAMAYGVPVISSHPPVHVHLSPDCPIVHADPLTITDRLRELVINPALRIDIGRRSYEWVRQFHSNERIANHLLRIYQEDLGWQEAKPRNTLSNKDPKYGG